MLMTDIILKKRHNKKLTDEEIAFFIKGYVDGSIPDYQVSAFLMSVCFNGMDKEETSKLTYEMMHSGEVVDLSMIKGIKVDKHSTGGVGDKTSLVLGPMVSACGAKVAKMSGRGLGHTGGTIDKLESIPGFNTSLTQQEFFDQVKKINIAVIGQTSELVPADKKLYALRDVTATVDSMPLIASSIISKKLASGSSIIELDVKYGDGAFMKSKRKAKELASLMQYVGNKLGRKIKVVISDMNQPLGNAIGNSLEVIECIETLKGNGPKDLTSLCLHICSEFLYEAKIFDNLNQAYEFAKETLYSGKALEKFKEFVKAQGGNENVADDYSLFKQPKYKYEIYSPTSGKVKLVKALSIGIASMNLGGGRKQKDDIIDMSAGIILNKKANDEVKENELLATLYTDKVDIEDIKQEVLQSFIIQ